MKSVGTWLVAGAVLVSANVRAQDAAAADKPYASIVARNMFGLLPIPVHNPEDDKPPVDPPPKITPNGIMNIFGRWEALFKVDVKGKPGQPVKVDSHVLAEGEREDDIEVVKINQPDGIVTFNNHGEVQELPLVVAKDTGPAAGPGGGPGGNPAMGIPRPGPISAAERAALIRGRPMGGVNPGMGGNPGQPPMPTPNFGGASSQPQNTKPQNIEDQVMSAAREMATIEQNRIATQDLVDKGLMPPLPPTMLTPPDAHVGDSPLITSPSAPPSPSRR